MKKKKIIIGSLILIVALLCCTFLAFRAAEKVSDITENQVEYENGDIIYIPDEETLCFDEEECALYYNNLLSVYLLSDLSNEEKELLADSIDGEVVGNISGCVNYMQIKVKESTFEELNHMAESISQSEHVLYVSYDSPMFMQPLEADNNPWSVDTVSPEKRRGKEDNPDRNDWWAEAIGAYTAWKYADSHADELESVQVGVIDGGFFTEHEDLEGKIKILDGWNMVRNEKDELDSHGTAVSGIIAANNNSVGLRGVADKASLICADWSLFDQNGESISRLDTGEYIELTKQMIESKCRVINCSFGNVLPSKEFFTEDTVNDITHEIGIFKDFVDYTDVENLYELWMSYCLKKAENTAANCTSLIIELLLNGYDRFLMVQGAGNGYDNSTLTPGYDAEYSGFYSGITVELYDRLLGNKSETLKKMGIEYQHVDEHIVVVGATDEENVLCEWACGGKQVDLYAPGEKLFVCETVENGISKYNNNYSGTSFSAPMVSGAAALLWSINPDLTAAEVRDLLLQSNHNAVGVGTDEGTIYPMLNIGESVKKLTGWSNYANIQEGLYIVPNTQNVLYVEQDEDEISFTAWWFKLASIEETAKLDGNDAEFVCGEESTGQTSGKLHFEDSKVILTLDDNRFPYLDEQTEYSWLREDLWKLSKEQLQEIGKTLKVPENLNVEYTQDEAYYWEVGGRYTTYVQVLLNGDVIAAANVDSFTGELIRDIWMYSDSNIHSSDVNIPNGAIEKYGHTYYIFDVADVTSGQAAVDFCKNRGGYLATITSEEENEFLFNYMIESGYQNAYFGFSDFYEEGNWQWLDGEPVSFTNWHDGEPNGGSSENYAMFYDKYPNGTWNDGGCANSNGEVFICEWE